MGDSAEPAIPAVIWNLRHLDAGATFDIEVLAKIGPTDAEAVEAIISAAESPIDQCGRGNLNEKETALTELGKLTQNRGTLRHDIVACLVKVLTDSEDKLSSDTGFGGYALNTSLAALGSISGFGGDAKEVIPLLKRLKLNEYKLVRETASSALEQIDK